MTRRRLTLGSVALFSMLVLGGRVRIAAVSAAPTLSVVRSATIAGPNFVADFNGDGLPDVAGNAPVAPGANVSKVRVALGTGGVVADLNGDGRPDLAVPNEDSHSVSVFLNQGAFAFSASDIPIDRRATGITAADVTGDGKIDLIATAADGGDTVMGLMYTAGFVYVFNGRGDGTFAAPAVRPVAPGAYRVVVGDFTRDGVMDIATANFSTILYDDCGRSQKTWDSVSILRGLGGGAFGASNSFSIGNQMNVDDPRYRNATTTLTAVDLNGDGALDLYSANGVFFLNQ